MNPDTTPTPSAFEASEKPTYNPPATVRQQHAPTWINRIIGMFRGSVRPEQQRNFEMYGGGTGGTPKTKRRRNCAVMKRRRLRDIAKESRKRNRGV